MERKTNVTFSVVMPVYYRDTEHYPMLIRTMESVLKHSKDFEFIIVDDGSTQSFTHSADVLIRHVKNLGIAPSWNDGIAMARGNFIAVINDDIEVCEGWLEGMKKCFDEEPLCGVSAPAVEHMPRKKGIMEDKIWFPGSCFMLFKGTVEAIGYFDEQFVPFNCEDVDYWARLTESGMKMMRNYDIFIKHAEGDVLHKLDYKQVDNKNIEKLINKWGCDPRPQFYA